MEVRHNFHAATSASKKQFDDETIRGSLHLEVHNLKQGQNESVNDFCFGLERKYIRLNIKADFYKLLLFVDGVKPDIRFEVRKYVPKTYAEAKSLARNLEAALNEKFSKTAALAVAFVGDASLVGSMEHQLSDLQTQIDALKRSLARFQSNSFRSRNFRTSFSRNTSSPTSSQATVRKRSSTRNLVCYKCRQKGRTARRCCSRVGNLDSYNSFPHLTQNRVS